MKTIVFPAVLFALFVTSAAASVSEEFRLVVFFDKFVSRLYDSNDDVELEFGVCLPKYQVRLPIRGHIIKVIRNPWWYPTKATRAAYFAKHKVELPEAVPPGDPRNAMGKAKFVLESDQLYHHAIMIHGTNNRASIGKRESRGCIRAFNESVDQLADRIETDLKAGKKVPFVFDN